MNRVIVIMASGLALAGCTSSGGMSSDWFPKFEPKPVDVQFTSQPAGAEARTSTGQTCQTPCSVAVPPDKDFAVTFSLAGFQPQTISVQPTKGDDGFGELSLQPNPVEAQLVAAPKGPPRRTPRAGAPAQPRPTATRPTATPRPAATAPAAAQPAPAASTPGDPWPNVR